jgi:tyrosyl-tRNA synthetase
MTARLSKVLQAGRDLHEAPPRRVLWGVAPTGAPHFGYLLPLLLMDGWREQGAEIVPVLANWHGYLDDAKSDWSSINARSDCYLAWLRRFGYEDVAETRSFYGSRDYVELLFRVSPDLNLSETVGAGATTLRRTENASLADAIYVATQVVDVAFFNADCALCGLDEAPIYEFGLPILWRRHGHDCMGAYTIMAPGLTEPEMHASSPAENKILFENGPDEVRGKIRGHLVRYADQAGPAPLVDFVFNRIGSIFDLSAERERVGGRWSDPERVADATGAAIGRLIRRLEGA